MRKPTVSLRVLGQVARQVARLHAAVDAMAAPVARGHEARLHCRKGCSGCCVDDLTVFEVEADAIVQAHGALLAEATPHAVGRCAFLDAEGACRVYASRPYVCRTQGLPLRWIEEDEAGAHELRDICALNVEGRPLEELGADECWTIGPAEGRLAAMQADVQRGEGELRRVSLRSLFARS